MTIEIVDFPIENGDFHSYVSLPRVVFNDSLMHQPCGLFSYEKTYT